MTLTSERKLKTKKLRKHIKKVLKSKVRKLKSSDLALEPPEQKRKEEGKKNENLALGG